MGFEQPGPDQCLQAVLLKDPLLLSLTVILNGQGQQKLNHFS